jgi:lipoprotein-releasing system permease protein
MRSLPFSLFLALRYLKPKRTFLSIITLISVVGVMLGVMILILVTSVMTGFELEIKRSILQFEAHMIIGNGGVMRDWRPVAEQARKAPGIVAAAPFVQGPVILQGPRIDGVARRLAPKVRGVDPVEELKVIDVKKFMVDGSFDLSGDNAVLGSSLAQNINAQVGDTVIVYTPGNLDAVFDELEKLEQHSDDEAAVQRLKELILPTELTVSGIFETGRLLYDSEFFIVPLEIGQELYGLGDGIHGLTVITEDAYTVDATRERLRPMLPEDFSMATWIDMNRDRFESIRLERSLVSFLLFFIVVVAAFGIMSTLITVTVLKTREIGVLKALGATKFQIIRVFLFQGIVVGIFGTLAGLAMGMWLVTYRNEVRDWLSRALNIQVFPQGVYEFASIPAKVIPQDVTIICACAFVTCTLAALIPAWFAARLDPVKSLRYE